MKNLISIITQNYNGEKYLKTFLESVCNSSFRNFELILVDDASTDKSVEIIKNFQKKDKRIKLFLNKKNLGAAASRNRAIKKAKGEIIVFVDNDTKLRKNSIEELVKPLLKNKEIGASQALLLDFEKRDLIQMAGGLLIPQTLWLIPFYQWQKYSNIKNELTQKNIVAISACLAVKRGVIDKVVGFDEKEAVYTEDLDFSFRIWLSGFKIVLAPKSIVYHHTKSFEERKNMFATKRKIYFHLAKNSFHSIIKNYELINLIKYLPQSILINIGRGFYVLIKRRDFSALLGAFQGLIWILFNLKDTISERRIVQSLRKLSDSDLKDCIFTKQNLFSIYRNYFS